MQVIARAAQLALHTDFFFFWGGRVCSQCLGYGFWWVRFVGTHVYIHISMDLHSPHAKIDALDAHVHTFSSPSLLQE